MLGPELGMMEMSEGEYTNLQHLIQAHVEVQAAAPPDGPDARPHPATAMGQDPTGSTLMSPFTITQAIDLSISNDEHCLVMPGEKTPASYAEIPGFVLARVRGEDGLTEPCANCCAPSRKRSTSAARVCLEKRFKTMPVDTPREQDIQSAVLNNFLTMLQQSAEAQEAAIHPQMQMWMKAERANPFEGSSPFVGGIFNPVTNTREQVISHIPHVVEPIRYQGLIIPKSFACNLRPERAVTKAHYTSDGNSTGEQQLVNIENEVATPAAASSSTCSSQPVKAQTRKRPELSLSQRRERHNSKERERRKRIRSSCDELNMLVPFCDSNTDKATTLQWTTAFLRYIYKMYGDTFKEEFQKAFTDEKGLFQKSSDSSFQDPIHHEMDETLCIPLTVEQ